MKNLVAMLILLFVVTIANAQFFEKNALYVSSEVAIGNYFELNANLNLLLNNKYSLQCGGSWNIRGARSKPDDYSSGVIGLFTLGLSEVILDEMNNFQVLFSRIYHVKNNRNIRFNLAGGIGYSTISEPTNWVKTNGSLGPNYSYDMEKLNALSLIINPKIEFPFSRIFGVTVSPMLQMNGERSFIGIGVGSMIGVLRQKTN